MNTEKLKKFGYKLLSVASRAVFVIPNKKDSSFMLALKVAALGDAVYQEFFKPEKSDEDNCKCGCCKPPLLAAD